MRQKGFTLIEIAVVLAIVMALITLGMGVLTSQLRSGAYLATKKRQELIKDALMAYLGSNKRLPCPSDVTGVAPPLSSPVACPAPGIIPFSTLGISRETALDSWGNYFTYRVYADATPSCPSVNNWDWGNSNCFGEGKDGITPARSAQSVRDGNPTTFNELTPKSIAVVISHGPNGLGAWAAQGTRNAAPTTCVESHNAPGTTPPGGCVVAANTYSEHASAGSGTGAQLARMKLAAILVEIRRRSRTLPPPHVDPLQAIHQRCHAAPETLENKTLMRIARAIDETRNDSDDADIWALWQESLGVLDALIERRLSS